MSKEYYELRENGDGELLETVELDTETRVAIFRRPDGTISNTWRDAEFEIRRDWTRR